jgi:hypothetical protein
MADVGDFLGLQDFVTDSEGNKVATKFCNPEWLTQSIAFCKANPDKRAAIFIDEINRAARFDLLGPVFQMALDRKLHTTEFPANLDVICAANPATKNYKVLAVTDEALLSRFWHVNFSPSAEEWRNHIESKGVDNAIINFLSEQPSFLEQGLESISLSDFAKPDRRKWEMVNRLRKSGKIAASDEVEVYSGLIGVEAAVAFAAHLEKAEKPIELDEILNKYNSVREKIIKAATTSDERTRIDVIHNAVGKITQFFKEDPDFTTDQGKNIISFIKDLPNESFFATLHAIYRKRKFHDFCEENYEALDMTAIEKRLETIRGQVPDVNALVTEKQSV